MQGFVNFAQQCALILAVLLPTFLYASALGLFLFAVWGLWQQAQPHNPFRGKPWIPWVSLILSGACASFPAILTKVNISGGSDVTVGATADLTSYSGIGQRRRHPGSHAGGYRAQRRAGVPGLLPGVRCIVLFLRHDGVVGRDGGAQQPFLGRLRRAVRVRGLVDEHLHHLAVAGRTLPERRHDGNLIRFSSTRLTFRYTHRKYVMPFAPPSVTVWLRGNEPSARRAT